MEIQYCPTRGRELGMPWHLRGAMAFPIQVANALMPTQVALPTGASTMNAGPDSAPRGRE